MDTATLLAIAALVLGAAALTWAVWTWRHLYALGLGLGLRAGPLAGRLEQVGRRLEALQAGHGALEEAVAGAGLRPTVVHYAPLGLGGARHCFALALLNRHGDGVVLNYLAGTATRIDLKEVRGWASQGTAFTAEEQQAVAMGRQAWGQG